jgi:hypothetical protein
LAILPQDPAVTFDQAMDELRASQGRSLPSIIPVVDRAAQLDPLSASPFLFHGLADVLAGRAPSISSLEAARRLNPRFGEARLLLFDVYARNGRAGDAIREAQSLGTILPTQRTLIVRLTAGLAGRPGGRAALARALPTSNVRGPVMLRLAQTGAERPFLLSLARPMQGLAANDPTQRKWVGSLVRAIANRPDPVGARFLWGIFYNLDPARVGMSVVDPEFSQGEGNAPFGWTLPRTRAGLAEFSDGKLDIFYYGRAPATFAQQMLTLPPGNYSIQTRASAASAEQPRSIAWRMVCSGKAGSILNVPLSEVLGRPNETAFTVPAAECPAQQLELIGIPDDISSRQSVIVESVTIESAS